MSKVFSAHAVSVDGYISGRTPDGEEEFGRGLGDAPMLFDWYFDGDTPSKVFDGFKLSEPSARFFDAIAARVGVAVAGRTTCEHSGHWGGGGPHPTARLFVLLPLLFQEPFHVGMLRQERHGLLTPGIGQFGEGLLDLASFDQRGLGNGPGFVTKRTLDELGFVADSLRLGNVVGASAMSVSGDVEGLPTWEEVLALDAGRDVAR